MRVVRYLVEARQALAELRLEGVELKHGCDIEHLGKSANTSQLNAMVYMGNYNASCTSSVTPTQDPQIVSLGFDTETDFHVYDIEWTPDGVKYYADSVLLRILTTNITWLKRPMNILLTILAFYRHSAHVSGRVTDASPSVGSVSYRPKPPYD